MFDKIKSIFKKPDPIPEATVKAEPKIKKPRKPKEPKVEKVLSEKEKATLAGEPYVQVIRMDIDPNDINAGSFELDWNEIFIARLVKAGYMMKKDDKDSDIIDRWWTEVCRNTVLEIYEQGEADLTNRDVRPIRTRDIGNGRTEVS
jgi:hypothetical protein